jgi:transcriptional regulator with XRE-family HTH domain
MEGEKTTTQSAEMRKSRPSPKSPKLLYFFRQWRKHRGMTQEELAETIGVTPPSISQLENGKQGFTNDTLEALAEALNCTPGDLLMRNPLADDGPLDVWGRIRVEDRARALEVLKAFAVPKKVA